MKLKMISGILTLSIVLALAFISDSCNNSSNKKTESTDQGATAKDSSENTVFDSQQQTSMLSIDTVIAEKPTLEKEKTVEKTANKQDITPRVAKGISTTKKDLKPSRTSKTISKPAINEPVKTTQPTETETSKAKTTDEQPQNDPESPTKVVPKNEEMTQPPETETNKAKTTDEQPKSDPEIPTKVAPEKEETKVATQPEPKLIEEPKEVIVAQPAKEETKVVEPSTDDGAVPAKDNNKATRKSDGWKAPASSKKLENPVPVNKSTLASARKSYEKECHSCHGRKGKGDGPNALGSEKKVPNLLKLNTQEQTDGELYWKITEGRKPMPSAKKSLTDEQRWAVVNYMRNLYTKYGKKKK